VSESTARALRCRRCRMLCIARSFSHFSRHFDALLQRILSNLCEIPARFLRLFWIALLIRNWLVPLLGIGGGRASAHFSKRRAGRAESRDEAVEMAIGSGHRGNHKAIMRPGARMICNERGKNLRRVFKGFERKRKSDGLDGGWRKRVKGLLCRQHTRRPSFHRSYSERLREYEEHHGTRVESGDELHQWG